MLTTMKGLPLAYNRDLQEDKEGFFDTVDTLLATLTVFEGMIETLKIKSDVMVNALDQGYLLATDLADYLVKKGETFRGAHAAVGKLVNWAIEAKKTFREINLSEYKKFSALFENDVYFITSETSIASRNNPGGTSSNQVKMALKQANEALSASTEEK
jgi:argininosuccinate lyase